MYITYNTRQWRLERIGNRWGNSKHKLIGPHDFPTRRVPRQLPKPSFTPTWLVRTSDMTAVPGSSVSEGYCALSYSWDQSGDITAVDEKTGEAKRVDEGKHRIIFPARTVRKKTRGRKRTHRKVKFVKFEGIIQQVCKDFNIKYIWWDQMCIPQDDLEVKQHEIHQMHQVYRNAYCTVVLVPDYETKVTYYNGRRRIPARYDSSLRNVEWLQRLWTFEEALLSRKLCFVGRDVHTWWYAVRSRFAGNLRELCGRLLHTNASWWNACKTLRIAHSRTTSRDHDRVFGLASIFPDIVSAITVDYKQSLPDLMIQFYGLLAKKDLSILCFGRRENNPMDKYNFLPSWTGAAGGHYDNRTLVPNNNVIVDVNGKFLHVTCTALISNNDLVAAVGEDTTTWTFDDIPPKPEGPTQRGYFCSPVINIQLPGRNKKTTFMRLESYNGERRFFTISKHLQFLSRFIPFKKENISWYYHHDYYFVDEGPRFYLNSVEKEIDYHADGEEGKYVILSGIQFIWDYSKFDDLYMTSSPVIKKEGGRYKAIGTSNIQNPAVANLLKDYAGPTKKLLSSNKESHIFF